MNAIDCAREAEVVNAVLSGRTDCEELHMHAEGCEVCTEVMAVAALLRDDRELARGDVPVPAAGQVWWRAAVRARLDATRAAARPLTWAQAVAGACAAGLTAGAMTLAWPTVTRIFGWLEARAWSLSPAPQDVAELVTTAIQRSLPFAVAAAAALVLAPLALYLALSDD